MDIGEWAGVAVGVLLSPAIALATVARRGRVFHPQGGYYTGSAEAVGDEGPWDRAGRRLAGPVLARVSGGARPIEDRRRDLVGIALRFHDEDTDGLTLGLRDQDLLFASFESLSTLGAGARATDTRDLLANTYTVAMRYRDPDLGQDVTFRLVPEPGEARPGDNGLARLDAAVADGGVVLHLQAGEGGAGEWRAVADIRLQARFEGDDRHTRYAPLNVGRGMVPAGFVAGLRRVAYTVGPWVRGASEA